LKKKLPPPDDSRWKSQTEDAQRSCPDCDAAARAANSDATTPGYFYRKRSKHRMEVTVE
jgi:hypothetical protein